MSKKLLIVESPNKCSTLSKILGSDWMVQASVGHITQLSSDGDDRLGFTIEQSSVQCRYEPNGQRGASVIKKLRDAVKLCSEVYLATDPDREGEAISWHLQEQLKLKNPKRVTYTQITESAVKAAIASPRSIDLDLVQAQQARQCLDKLVGFTLSRMVQVAGAGKSAGRVQSAALHLVCDRERVIQTFKPSPFWSLSTEYIEGFRAVYAGTAAGDSSHEIEEAFDESVDPTESKSAISKRIESAEAAEQIVKIARSHSHEVVEVSGKKSEKAPPSPLTTSALQQAAGVKYGFSPDETMELAQQLFEGAGTDHGLITYHRTDSISLSPEFCAEVRAWLQANDPDNVPAKTTKFKEKDGSQGAHEAIRPVDVAAVPDQLVGKLSDRQLKIYSLIWSRAVASQCAPAVVERSKVVIKAGSTYWQLTGAVMQSPGYTVYVNNLGGDVEIPNLQQGQTLSVKEVKSAQKQTSPPGRFSEPQLVQMLEKLGIGRPSTFASIMKTLRDREYVRIDKKCLIPTDAGLAVDTTLQKAFPMVLETGFTADLETKLDLIAEGKQNWEKFLAGFNFDVFQPALVHSGLSTTQQREKSEVACPDCGKSLTKLPSKFKGAKNHYLKCLEGCTDVILTWNTFLNQWMKKGQHPATNQPAGKLTEFRCPACGKPLEEFNYQKDGQPKTMLRCSDTDARRQPNHQDAVYFPSSKGGYWNPALKAEPSTEVKSKAFAKTSSKASAKTKASTGSKK